VTAPAPPRPRIDGAAPRTTTGRVRLLSLTMVAGPLLAMFLFLSLSVGNTTTSPPSPSGSGISLTLVRNGLLTDEPFATAEPMRTFTDRFELDPLAPRDGVVFAEVGDGGLDVGVHAHEGWEGYFAVTHDFYPASSVFHTDMEAIPVNAPDGGIGEAVFAVQTGSTKITSDVNFVTVNTYSRNGALKWQVGYSAGKYSDAQRVSLAQLDHPPEQLVADHPVGVTLRTDGYRTLTVYLDDTQVIDAADLELSMEPPFQPYLEVQAKDTAYTSRFTNFWVTASDTIRIDGLPEGAEVRIGAAAQPIASGTADAEGTARLRLPLPQTHGTAALAIRLPRERDWRQVSDAFTYSGGDRYRASVEGSA